MNKNWKYVPFDQLFEWLPKSNVGSRQGKTEGKYCLYIASAYEFKRYDDYLADNEALVFGTGGNPCIHYVDGKFAYTNHTEAAVAKNESVFPKFYYYYFQKNRFSQLQSTFVGGGIKNSSKRKIGALLVPVVDIDEQKQIVKKIEAMLSKLDESVETLQKTKRQLSVYRQAVLKETFDSVSNQCITSIEKLCQRIVDCPHSTPKWSKEGVLCLRTTNFKRGYLDLSEKNYVTKEVFEKRNARLIPLPGDVLYSREGAILGIACIIPENTYVCLGQRMMLFRTGENLYNRFLMYYLNSPNVTSFVKSITGGSASPHINVGDIKQFKISCPDIDTQKELSKELDKKFSICNGIEGTVDSALQQTEVLRQSILKQVFEGEA